MKKAIIIGASSGIGKALTIVLAENGYEVGLTARRKELLQALQSELLTKSYIRQMDVAQTEEARAVFQDLIAEMQDVDLVVINAGIGSSGKIEWERSKQIIEVNALGFAAIANAAMDYFIERGRGHIAGISSIAGIKGLGRYNAYSASKAFISNYMQGMRQQAVRKNLAITITDVKPGFVATPMTENNQAMFWVAPVEKAAQQIYTAIQKRKNHVYVTKRWRLVGWLLKILPEWVYLRIPGM
mgnify:CR=1 FL=1